MYKQGVCQEAISRKILIEIIVYNYFIIKELQAWVFVVFAESMTNHDSQ